MSLTKHLFQSMLRKALEKIETNLDYLNQLDSATGDGDHGTAIKTAMQVACKAAQGCEGSWVDLFSAVGWEVMGGTSGSTSAITGAFYTGMGNALGGHAEENLDADTFIAMFESALANVRTVSRAQVGDKTIMDAMIPAVATMSALKGKGSSHAEVMQAGADAATIGAASTKDLTARFGRAKNLGERSRGHLDAGASSLAIIFQAFAETLR